MVLIGGRKDKNAWDSKIINGTIGTHLCWAAIHQLCSIALFLQLKLVLYYINKGYYHTMNKRTTYRHCANWASVLLLRDLSWRLSCCCINTKHQFVLAEIYHWFCFLLTWISDQCITGKENGRTNSIYVSHLLVYIHSREPMDLNPWLWFMITSLLVHTYHSTLIMIMIYA